MNKQEMLDKIYEVIADKTLSFWCICIVDSMKPIRYRMVRGDERPQEEILKIIGHPVMIWNILKWADINSNRVQEETHLSRDLEVHRQQIVQIYYYFVRWDRKSVV